MLDFDDTEVEQIRTRSRKVESQVADMEELEEREEEAE